jgi:prepilin-type N-terminal cleavage/methylation domain-containing protein
MKRHLTKEEGFTLIEVMTSMIIMSFSLLLLLHMAMVALDGNKWATGTTSSTQLIQAKLEDLRSIDDPAGGVDTVNGVMRHWRVVNSGSHLRQILITATDLNNTTPHSYSMSTYLKTVAP